MWILGILIGAGLGYIIQPTTLSTVEGAVIGLIVGVILQFAILLAFAKYGGKWLDKAESNWNNW